MILLNKENKSMHLGRLAISFNTVKYNIA